MEQNQIAGMRKNFSTMEHSCRKCMCSRTDLKNALQYSDIHSSLFEERTDESLQANYLEAAQLKRNNINGVYTQALYFQFPYFISSKMLPQCSSHDFLGTIHNIL